MENEVSNSSQQTSTNSAYDLFLYLVVFLSLAFVSFGLGSILFGFIDKYFNVGDIFSDPDLYQGFVKFGIAALVVAGPVYFLISWVIYKRICLKQIALESKIRKWTTHIVLFLAAATIIGDLISLVVNFLGGDYTTGFLLKVFVILFISAGIFGYYFWDMKRAQLYSDVNKIAIIAAMIIVVFVFIAGFFIIDSPKVSRQKNIDQQTVYMLQSTDSSVQNYFNETGRLPGKLEDLQSTKYSIGNQNLKKITYNVNDLKSYELCADFFRSSLNNGGDFYSNDWKHDSGNFCFKRTALDKNNSPKSLEK